MRNRRTQTPAAEVDLTPMLDVVFILLIFFIVTAVFIQEEAIALEPPLPESPSRAEVPAIIIAIEADGIVRVNGRLSLPSSVRANIERLRAETPNSAVIVQAHPEAKNGLILRIRDAVASARVERVNLVLSDI